MSRQWLSAASGLSGHRRRPLALLGPFHLLCARAACCCQLLFWTTSLSSTVTALVPARPYNHQHRSPFSSNIQGKPSTSPSTYFRSTSNIGLSSYHKNIALQGLTSSRTYYSSSSSRLSASTLNLEFGTFDNDAAAYNATVIIGRTDSLRNVITENLDILNEKLLGNGIQDVVAPIANMLMDKMSDKTGGSSSTMLLRTTTGESDTDDAAYTDPSSLVHQLHIGGLPTKNISRYNHPMSVHTLTKKVRALCPSKGSTRVIVLVPPDDEEDEDNEVDESSSEYAIGIAPIASAIAKSFPQFSMKTTSASRKKSMSVIDNVKQVNGVYNDKDDNGGSTPRTIHVVFVNAKDGSIIDDEESLAAAKAVTSGVQLATRLVDSHPELLTTTRFAKEVEAIVKELNTNAPGSVKMKQIIGEELRQYGGLYAVGKAASCPPRMILLEYDGSGGAEDDVVETVALVGKGIIYDTGGLSLKSKTGMVGMKSDMGGAAGMLGGFYSAVQLKVPTKLHCILCLAENAIGPDAFRNDDILTMYSGKTVEVNNCDAEGRLVLADGVAHATRHIENLDLVVDMATLTGAQMIATGQKHGGILANTPELEERAMDAAIYSGDLCFPLLYAPDLLMSEFDSKVADMRNSVKERMNAQSSCAGHFIEAHLDESYNGGWLHVDMAGPSWSEQRGTGYGVGLVLSILDAPGF